jgi:leader peptidase (prepilin peptidase)/N-methyltransferase
MEDPVLLTALGILAGALGLVLGSFGNVLVFRVPEAESIGGRSHCPGCGYQLAIHDLVPVLSFLWLRGRCRKCRKPISVQYPLVELCSGLLFLGALAHEGFDPLRGFLLGTSLWLLLLIAVIDARKGLIPDALSFPFIAAGVLHGFLLPHFPLLPLLMGGGFFAAQWLVSRGRWVGSGDILLGIGIGAATGAWPLLLVALFASYILGSVVAGYLLLRKRKTMEGTLAFGPFLCVGTFVSVFWGPAILRVLLPY